MKYSSVAAILGFVSSTAAHGYHARRSPHLEERADRSTQSVARPQVGSVPYGTIIERCTVPGVVALTFDDGPSGATTGRLLDLLSREGVKATFFVTANNISPIESTTGKGLVQRAHAEGHQIAHHSWTHQDFSVISSEQRLDEILFPESAFASALGFFPTYIRPPYGSCNAECLSQLREFGYHVVNWDVDSLDWQNVDNIDASKQIINNEMTNSGNGHIVLAHDIHAATVDSLVAHMISTARSRNLRMVTVGECLGDNGANWYRTFTPTNPPTNPPTTPGEVSKDGTCGGTLGYTCLNSPFGNCCSKWGWCGNTDEHCKDECNPTFGSCGGGGGGGSTPPVLKPTIDGTCGGTTGFTCTGGNSGACCSKWGWCGDTDEHCKAECQSGFGICK